MAAMYSWTCCCDGKEGLKLERATKTKISDWGVWWCQSPRKKVVETPNFEIPFYEKVDAYIRVCVGSTLTKKVRILWDHNLFEVSFF